MSKTFISRSLSLQLLAGVLFSLLISLLSFGAFFALGNALLDYTIYTRSFFDKMSDRQFKKLQEYVTAENINADSLQQLNAWQSSHDSIYLAIYIDDALIFESKNAGSVFAPPEGEAGPPQDGVRDYTLVFGDGTRARTLFYYLPSDAFFYWMTVISFVLAYSVLSLCLVLLIHTKLLYIKKLKKELDVMAGGDLSKPVTVRGEDELSELASGIDEMRRSILKHQTTEAEIRSANSELVAAMSHDLRTPLTSLKGFLELLDEDKVTDEQMRRQLISRSLNQTGTIISMVNKLFEYSLVYTSEWKPPRMKTYDADELFSQFWRDYAFQLGSRGFTVETDFRELGGEVTANTEYMKRVFDNLYSNLIKYAEPAQPISINYRREGANAALTVINFISPQRDRKESTNMGLNTGRRILKMHRGTFEASAKDGRFLVELKLPITDRTAAANLKKS